MFSVAYSIGALTLFAPAYFLNPSLAFLSEAYAAGRHQDFSMLLSRNFKLSVSVAIPIATFLAITAGQVLEMVYGARFAQAWIPASFLSLAAIFWLGITVIGLGFASAERTWELVGLNWLWLFTFVVLAVISAPRWNAAGVAFSYAVSTALAFAGYTWYGSRSFRLGDLGAAKVAAVVFVTGAAALWCASHVRGMAIWLIATLAALAAGWVVWKTLYSAEERTGARSLLAEFNAKFWVAISRGSS
jgi:O-antigen/teichoic acid export membrane protein